jgi:NAD(P)-dependent dehydrogenase (short-subunit alcohol dehydrogenase family)
LNVNFFGYVSVVQTFLPMIREATEKPNARRGRVVMIGTGGGVPGPSPPICSAYMSSKWAVCDLLSAPS